MTTTSIGDLARQAGVGIDTVRYYERNGLLAPAGRRPSGYRWYGCAEFKRLRFIRRAKALGFSLNAIRELLSLSEQRNIKKVKLAAQTRLEDIEQRITELQRISSGLRTLIDACPGHGRADACPILNALTQEDSP